MSGQRELRDCLDKSYSRMNDLNGLVNIRHMEEELQRNSFKTKIKARNIITNLHQLLDAFYVHVLKTIDSTVVDTSEILKQHSSEIEDCVTYMAELCLIGEKLLKEDDVEKEDCHEVKDKLNECLSDSDVLKTVDYKACVQIDVDVDMEALVALPLAHIVSHSSDTATVTKLRSLRFDDLRQQTHDLNQAMDRGDQNSYENSARKPTSPRSIEMPVNVKPTDAQKKKVEPSMLRMLQVKKTLSKLPSDVPQEFDFSKISKLVENSAKSVNHDEVSRADISSSMNFKVHTPFQKKENKDSLSIGSETTSQKCFQENSLRIDGRKLGSLQSDISEDAISVSCDDLHDSGYETPALLTPRKFQDSSCMEQAAEARRGTNLFAKDFIPKGFIPRQLVAQQNVDPYGNLNNESMRSAPVRKVKGANQIICDGEKNIVDRNLTLLQSCFKNAQRQSWTLQSFPHKPHAQ